jgi:hypothetical protein
LLLARPRRVVPLFVLEEMIYALVNKVIEEAEDLKVLLPTDVGKQRLGDVVLDICVE